MIKSWDEIQERYDAIKDHKPRASKKLAELGEILSSAYAQDPEKASEMWQYIIDLNIADDIRFSKFYIAQVFNKLVACMKPADAVTFISMNPDRIRILLTESDDRIPYYHLENLLRGFIEAHDAHNAVVCICYYYNMYGGADSGSDEVMHVTRSYVVRIIREYVEDEDKKETITNILDELCNLGSEEISDYIEVFKGLNGFCDTPDYERLFELTKSSKLASDFFKLLWLAKDEYSEDELIDKWIDYVQDCDENNGLPWARIDEDSDDDEDEDKDYETSKLKYYVDLEKSSEELLDAYFGRASFGPVEEAIVWSWIEDDDWDSFTKHIAQAVMGTSEEAFDSSSLKDMLETLMDATMYDEYMDNVDDYGRSYKGLMADRGDAYTKALANISAISVGCDAHESYHDFIKSYIQKKNGNVDALNEAGFDEEVDTRTAIDRLKEYAHSFLESGKQVYEYQDGKLKSIMDALHDELYDRPSGNRVTVTLDVTGILAKALGVDYEEPEEDDEEENEPDLKIDQRYQMALDDDIAEFYFKHYPHDYHDRSDMISACIHRNDLGRAIELVDMMAETKGNEGYEELNGWGRQNMLTLHYLIDEFEWGKEKKWDATEDITDEMRENVKQLVYRMLPHLSESSRKELKEKWLHQIDPDSEDADDYIDKLLEDADAYSSFPRPRGKGGAQNVNRMTEEFMACFKRLSKMGRLDVVAAIMSKFAAAKDVLKPVPFYRWMSSMERGLSGADLINVYHANKDIFDAWLDCREVDDDDIIDMAESIAEGCQSRAEYLEFRDFVIAKKGKIEGLDCCYQATSENTETQLLVDAETVSISLDYIEFTGSNPLDEVIIHLLTTSKAEEIESVRLLSFEINGIECEDCGFTLDMDEDPTIGYYLFDTDEESEDELTVYTDFLEDNDINEVTKITLHFQTFAEEGELIEMIDTAVIELDSSGVYKVTKVGKSETRFTYVGSDDDEDEEELDDAEDDESFEEDDEDFDLIEDEDEDQDEDESYDELSGIVDKAMNSLFGKTTSSDTDDSELIADEDEADSDDSYDLGAVLDDIQSKLNAIERQLDDTPAQKEYMSLKRIIEEADFDFPIDVQAMGWEADKHMQIETIRDDQVYGSLYKGNQFVDMERLPLNGSGKYTFYN